MLSNEIVALKRSLYFDGIQFVVDFIEPNLNSFVDLFVLEACFFALNWAIEFRRSLFDFGLNFGFNLFLSISISLFLNCFLLEYLTFCW